MIGMPTMNFFSRIMSVVSVRRKALWMYRRGMARAKKHDHPGALSCYTAAIESASIPADVKAMALYNRALVHMAAGDESKGVDDLDHVLAMDVVIVNVKTMARQKLAKLASRTLKSNKHKH